MASHWPPIKDPLKDQDYRLLAVYRRSSFFLAEAGVRPRIPRDSPSRTQYKTEQSRDQTKKDKSPRLPAVSWVASSKNSEAAPGSLQFLGFIEISGQFCLTRLRAGPIIDLFWQPSRSLPAGKLSSRMAEVQVVTLRSASSSGCRAIGSEGRDPAPTAG